MKKNYDHQKIEKKWRKIWLEEESDEVGPDQSANNYYCLDMFPYPSGDGLHVGHWRGYVLSDFYARYQKLQGKTVLHPMGFDAFGLPAENAAIKKKSHPKVFTDEAIKTFTQQLHQIGAMYDWTKVINTSDPNYYKWTQWLFLQLFKHGLAEKRLSWVNWCPKDQTVLANEQVVGGACERCGSKVTKKELSQWYLKITDFADPLLQGLEILDWPENVKTLQKNWIGRSEGANVVFHSDKVSLQVFTTRVDTLFGVSAIVLAPEHHDVANITTKECQNAVLQYIEQTKEQTELDRQKNDQVSKTGVFTGSYALHPFTHQQLPIWIADYVLPNYGSGAVMLVPAHDERDFAFAKGHNLPILPVIEPEFIDLKEPSYVREGLPFAERDGIVAIVKHWSEDKYLGLKWKKVAWGTWITGGIESGQTPEATARAEILEEVGYKNLRLIKEFGRFHSKYYHNPKGENRHLVGHCFYFELENDGRETISNLETGIHEPVWLSNDEVTNFLTADAHKWTWDQLRDDPTMYSGNGYLINSGIYDGIDSQEAAQKIAADLEQRGIGGPATTYRLRDWLVSRQRYWGAPIPIVYDPEGNPHAVEEGHLPILLPTDVDFQPGGESPIKRSKEYQARAEQLYGKGWYFETDTLDTFVDSSWYYLRFLSPNDEEQAFDPQLISKWLPVNLYIGGIEHAILHLLYARFIYQFLVKYQYIKTDLSEPFKQLFNIGMINLHGAKMSKSKGNVISPDALVEHYGTDALRGYELFLGPMDSSLDWNPRGINGVHRFLIKLYQLNDKLVKDSVKTQETMFDGYLTRITAMIKDFRLNTVLSEAMVLVNNLTKAKVVSQAVMERFVQTLSPIFPFITEEIWSNLENKKSIFLNRWPKVFDAAGAQPKVKVLINQKFVGELDVEPEQTEKELLEIIKGLPEFAQKINTQKIIRTIYKSAELINIITK